MAKLPDPPSVDRLRELRDPDDVVAVATFTRFARIYRAGGPHACAWNHFRTVGPVATARFDPHPPTATAAPADSPGHGVLYAGLTLRTALAETFQAARVVDRHTGSPWLVVFRPRRTLHLLDLTGTWPTRAGASQAISSGRRDRARAWARQIFSAYADVDGLWYPSSMDGGSPAVVLWERARPKLATSPELNLPLDAPGLALPVARAARQVGYLFV